ETRFGLGTDRFRNSRGRSVRRPHDQRGRRWLRAVLRLHTGFWTRGERCEVLRCAAGIARGEGRTQGRRHIGSIWGQADQEFVRLHGRIAPQQSGRRGRSEGIARWQQTHHRIGETGTKKVDQNKAMLRSHIARPLFFALLLAGSALLAGHTQTVGDGQTSSGSLALPSEKHLRNVRQLTFGGTNAEAYFSGDDKYLIFMHQGEGVPCDQIFTMPVDTPDGKPAKPRLVSTGKGRTTCGYFYPDGNRVLFS